MEPRPFRKAFSLEKGTDIPGVLENTINELCEQTGLSDRDCFQLRLVLDELATNTSSYGFEKGSGSRIDLEIEIDPDRYYQVTYRDDSSEFDPFSYSNSEIESGTESAAFGGFGIALVKKMMDTVSYKYENNKNVIFLKKFIS